VPRERVEAVRSFNRFYTNVIGVLRADLLRTRYSLTEARVIVELGAREVSAVTDLRRDLDIDAGFLSRILARLEADRLISRERSEADARRQVIRLTDLGRAEREMLVSRAVADIERLLSGLTDEDQRRLTGAMGAIREILGNGAGREAFTLRPLTPGDCGWVVHRHGVLYAREYGWDETFEALVARIVADYMERQVAARSGSAPEKPEKPERPGPPMENAWIAEVDGERAGCVFCMHKQDGERVAQLRLLLVEPGARGLGIGGRLVRECVGFARKAGYEHVMLWTNDVLTDARRLYERAGFRLRREEPHHSYGHDLVGQDWWLSLTE
jgi:DNA-binding MarR family transcriptional regulator/ribosomal protein S18 acetylase RimI-like enzyme